jgi:hypothetical protein
MRSLRAHVNVQTAAAPSFNRRGDWSGVCALDLRGFLTSKLERGGSRPSAKQARGIRDPQLLKTTNGIRISNACAPVTARACGCAWLFDIVNV